MDRNRILITIINLEALIWAGRKFLVNLWTRIRTQNPKIWLMSCGVGPFTLFVNCTTPISEDYLLIFNAFVATWTQWGKLKWIYKNCTASLKPKLICFDVLWKISYFQCNPSENFSLDRCVSSKKICRTHIINFTPTRYLI